MIEGLIEPLLTEPLNSIIYGFAAFMISFVVLSILWSMFLKLAESFFSKSKFYFIPRILKEVNRSIFLAVIMVSIYFGLVFYEPTLADSALIKVWGVVLIIIITEIIAKMILNILDHYYVKSKKYPTFFSNAIPMMKRVMGVVLYVIAILLIINYLNSEVGTIVAAIGFLVLIFLFVLYQEQLKNIMAGFQLIGAHVREGDYVHILEYQGFVERILEQQTILRDIDGKTILIPNSVFLKEVVKNNCFSEGNLISLSVRLDDRNIENSKKRLSKICGKIALGTEGVMKDYKPKVFVSGVKEKNTRMNIKFIVFQNADMRAILDSFNVGIKKEFKEKVVSIRLE